MRADRRDGSEAFGRVGLPTRRVEEWRFTDVTEIARGRFLPAAGPTPGAAVADALKALPYLSEGCACLVIVDGFVDPELSVWPEQEKGGIELLSLSDFVPEEGGPLPGSIARADFSPFSALNAAFLRDGAVVRIAADAELDKPVHLVYVSAASGTLAPSNLVMVGEGPARPWGRATSPSPTPLNSKHRHGDLGRPALRWTTTRYSGRIVTASTGAYGGSLGGTSVFSKTRSILAASGAKRRECHAGRRALPCDTQRADARLREAACRVTIPPRPCQPNCESQSCTGDPCGRSRSVFNGKIFVRPGAQKTDAKQTNRNLLLSNQATADTKPQLEIFADDVKCTHGATVGQLSDEEVFYLRSRGMSEEAARRMLTYGFANDIVERVKPEAIRLALHDLQAAALGSTADIGE